MNTRILIKIIANLQRISKGQILRNNLRRLTYVRIKFWLFLMSVVENGFHNNIFDCGDSSMASFVLLISSGAVPRSFGTFAFIRFIEPILANYHNRVAITRLNKIRCIWNEKLFEALINYKPQSIIKSHMRSRIRALVHKIISRRRRNHWAII